MTLVVLNDVHIGVVRSAGTTPVSQWALRQHVLNEFAALLPVGKDVLLLGDLFDTANVPIHDVLKTYEILSGWLQRNPQNVLYNVAGNHDLSKTSNVMSSFQFLGQLLMHVSNNYVHIEAATAIPYGYVIPHVPNQDIFNLELSKVPTCKCLFLHCNYANGFAAQSDQSLNLSVEQAAECKAEHIVIAHEHQPRTLGKVILPGNQIASSVSDWIGADDKYFVEVDDTGFIHLNPLKKSAQFTNMNWKEVAITDHKFVRITGEATADEAVAAIATVGKLRNRHEAFVVSNAVQIKSTDDSAVFEANLEAIQSFSVLDALKEIFTADEMKVLEEMSK